MDNKGVNNFFETEAFAALDGNTQQALKEFEHAASGKSPQEMMAAFISLRGKLNADEDGQKALSLAMRECLSPENREKLDFMERFMRSYK